MGADKPRPATKRKDEVGDLARLLETIVTHTDEDEAAFDVTVKLLRAAFNTLTRGRGPDDTIRVPVKLLSSIIAALDYVPRRRGNLSRKIRRGAQIQEHLVLLQLHGLKQKLMDEKGLSAVQAELEVAEDPGPALFLKRTGRRLKPETIRRFMQRRWRRPRRNTDA